MSKLSIYPAFIAGHSLEAAAIMTILVDRFLRDRDDYISIGDLAQMIGQEEDAVAVALRELGDAGLIEDDKNIGDMVEIKVSSLSLVTRKEYQMKFDDGAPKKTRGKKADQEAAA